MKKIVIIALSVLLDQRKGNLGSFLTEVTGWCFDLSGRTGPNRFQRNGQRINF
jgi:hypothetical protein